ncbi:MAG TPA: DUF6152 family protein [Gammaproteobacteria bacterium]
MQRSNFLAAMALSAAIASIGTASAHHSFSAVYDTEKTVTVSGVVTKVEWFNPHAHFFVDAKNEQGVVENWDFELASPNGLMRLGWTRKSLQEGDAVTVEAFRARDGSPLGNARSVTLADGTKMFTGEAVQGGLR